MADRRSTENGQEETKKLIAWQQCKVCGTSYPASQTVCYTCWRKAKDDDAEKTGNLLESRFSKSLVLKCGYELPGNFIRLNVDYPIPKDLADKFYRGGGRCFECTEKSYCRMFGNPFYTCKREDWEYCKCKMCCKAFREEAAMLTGK